MSIAGAGSRRRPDVYGFRVADELEKKILELGAETVAAFVAETVMGATAGAVPPTPGYFKRIREICDRYGILLIPRRSDVRHGPDRHHVLMRTGR